jgi:hypothetical protein
MASPHQQKLRVHGPVIVTGNRLSDGAVVHYVSGGGWSTDLADAAVATDPDQAVALLAEANADSNRGVGAYVAPIVIGEDGVRRPGNLRERIRSEGPTIALPGPGYPFAAQPRAA